MKELKVGQEIFLQPCGNAARHSTNIIATTVSKVGSKYFYTTHRNFKFYIDTMRHDNGGYGLGYDYIAYLSMQEIADETEKSQLITKIVNATTVGQLRSFPLETLRSIDQLLQIDQQDIDQRDQLNQYK